MRILVLAFMCSLVLCCIRFAFCLTPAEGSSSVARWWMRHFHMALSYSTEPVLKSLSSAKQAISFFCCKMDEAFSYDSIRLDGTRLDKSLYSANMAVCLAIPTLSVYQLYYIAAYSRPHTHLTRIY